MKTKYYSMFGKAIDKDGKCHMVTVVGEYQQFKEDFVEERDIKVDGEFHKVLTPIKKQKRQLKLAYSISHPDDKFDKEIGIKVAMRRLRRGEIIGELASYNFTMLNPDQIDMLLLNEVSHISKYIDTYILR